MSPFCTLEPSFAKALHGFLHACIHPECLAHLHTVGDRLAFGQDLGEVLGTEDVAKGGLGKKARRVMCVLDVCYRHRSVADSIVDDRVNRYRHRVFCQHLAHVTVRSGQWRFYAGARGHGPPKPFPGPPNFQGNYGT